MLNPYASPAEVEAEESPSWRDRLLGALIGGELGALIGAGTGIVIGAACAATHRPFHPHVLGGGDGILGLFPRLETVWEYIGHASLLTAIWLVLLGALLGFVQGFRARRIRLGYGGVVTFAFVGLYVGLINADILTQGMGWAEKVRQIEGPWASAVYGVLFAVISWRVFRRQMNQWMLEPEGLTSVAAKLSAALAGIVLLLSITVIVFGLGNQLLQNVTRCAAAVSVIIGLLAARSFRRTKSK